MAYDTEENKPFGIEVAKAKDETDVNRVLTASFLSLLKSSHYDISIKPVLHEITKINPTLLVSGTYYVVRNDRNVVIGCGGWTHERPGTDIRIDGEAHVRHFATHPDWYRHGVGKYIFDKCQIDARSEGVSKFICYATLNAEPFYKSLGFLPIEKFELDMNDGLTFPCILMKYKFNK